MKKVVGPSEGKDNLLNIILDYCSLIKAKFSNGKHTSNILNLMSKITVTFHTLDESVEKILHLMKKYHKMIEKILLNLYNLFKNNYRSLKNNRSIRYKNFSGCKDCLIRALYRRKIYYI